MDVLGRRGRLRPAVALAALALAPAARLVAAEPTATETLIAAAVFAVAKEVSWPPSAFPPGQHEFRLCAVGSTPRMMAGLSRLATRKLDGRAVVVDFFASASELEYCHQLFIGDNLETALMRQILSSSAGAPVLTVGSSKEFVELGGVVEIRPGLSRLVFEINTAAAGRAGLTLADKLTRLASKVVTE